MNLLIIDTTIKTAIIFLIKDNKRSFTMLKEDEKQSEHLMMHIDKFLSDNNVKLEDIDAFGVVTGPGSFTGIRVGIATVKAFANALNKPVIALNLFDIVKDEVVDGCFVCQCTSSSCYFANIKKKKIADVGIVENEQLKNIDKFFVVKEEHFSAEEAYNLNVLTNYTDLCFDKFFNMALDRKFSTPEPYYIQVSQAERNLEKKK